MKNRILSIALALSLLVVVFAAVPTHAAVDYTGSVKTTDNAGVAKSTFVQGETVYVNVMVKYLGALDNVPIQVRLVSTTGTTVSHFHAVTNTPTIGWYNSTTTGLGTGAGFTGDSTAYDVVVVYDGAPFTEIARTSIVVMKEGLTLDPSPGMLPYYPGETVTAKLVTTETASYFYVETVNATGSIVMNWTDQGAPTGYWTRTFQIPSDMRDGAYTMSVRDKATYAIWYQVDFEVQMYEFSAMADRYYYLPGETAKIQYETIDLATLSSETGVTVTYSAHWLNSSGNDTWQNGTLVGSSGLQEFLIPTDVSLYEDVAITYWANESTRSSEDYVTLAFGTLMGSVSVNAPSFVPGDTVVVTVSADVSWDSLPGAKVDISVLVNGTAAAAYGATNLTTDQNGQVVHTFKLVDVAQKGSYIVQATISKVGFSTQREAVFQVYWDGYIAIHFDKEYYTSGDSVTMTLTPIWNNQVVSVQMIGYFVQTGMGTLVFSNTTESSIVFDLPANYYGWVGVDAFAWYNGYLIEGFGTATVNLASVVLTAEQTEYRPGDTVQFAWQIVTGVTAGTLLYEITDQNGVKIATGAPAFAASGTFSFAVPATNAPTELNAKMWMTTADGGYAQASATAYMVGDHELMIWVDKSAYSDGSFKPGDMVTVHYSIGAYEHAQLPSYRLVVSISYNPIAMDVLLTQPTGTIKVQIPTDAPSADIGIYATLYDGTDGSYLSSDSTAVTVNAQNSGWDRNIAGMSAVNFTLLVLIIIMILLLIIVPFLRGRTGAPKPPAPEPVKVEPPPPAP